MTAAIELADVELRFGVFQVLDGISVAFLQARRASSSGRPDPARVPY
jgi:hypothetical protein